MSFASIVISIIPTVVFYLIAQEKVESSICSGVVKGVTEGVKGGNRGCKGVTEGVNGDEHQNVMSRKNGGKDEGDTDGQD